MVENSPNFFITNKTRAKIPPLPFTSIKETVLGKKYELSIVFIGEKRARALNKTYRKKDSIPNILSFSLSKNSGEIFMIPTELSRQCKNFKYNFHNFLIYILIHGLLHLKGFHHGSTMEKEEEKIRVKFGI